MLTQDARGALRGGHLLAGHLLASQASTWSPCLEATGLTGEGFGFRTSSPVSFPAVFTGLAAASIGGTFFSCPDVSPLDSGNGAFWEASVILGWPLNAERAGPPSRGRPLSTEGLEVLRSFTSARSLGARLL